MITMLSIVWAADAPEVPCPGVPPILDAAEAALVEVETDRAQKRMKEAEAKLLRCREIFDPETLGRLWVLEGVLRTVEGDEESARDAFRASGRVAPEAWEDVFGPAVRGIYELAVVRDQTQSSLEFLPELGGNRAWVDGKEHEDVPVVVEGGLHAVQISDPTGVVLFSQMLWLPPEDGMRLETGVPTAARVAGPDPEPGPAPAPVPKAPREPRNPTPWLVGGIGAVVLGGAAVAVSFERSASMEKAEDWDALRSRYAQHSATRIGGVGLMGLGAAAVGYSFTF